MSRYPPAPIVLQKVIHSTDDKWSWHYAKLSTIPRGRFLDETTKEEKVWLKSITVTNELIELRVEKRQLNRILAEDEAHRFILVSFGNLRFPDEPPKVVTEYIQRFLTNGVEINNCRYYFIGHSNSQLKDKSCYMYGLPNPQIKDPLQTIWHKVNQYGDFAKLKSISKRAKRIGLLFSTAESVIELLPETTEEIDDVELKGENFSDGCGMLSSKFASQIAAKRRIAYNNRRYTPSVFQIRYKGNKGVLMVNPKLEKTESGQEIKVAFRKSMNKFTGCSSNAFAVLEFSKPFTFGFLNAELVTLLSSLEISDEIFLKKQYQFFEFMKSAKEDPLTAFYFCGYAGQHEIGEMILLEGLTRNLQSRVKALVKEECSKLYKQKRSGEEEEKVRIMLVDSRILLGVCDYSGTLRENECFVRITTHKGEQTLDGAEVIVGRNPCLHPGDMRKFKAVDVPGGVLDHLRDCIVFPIVGSRPAPSMMSGGDLDGDKFFVSWDPDIIPQIQFEAYGYPPARERIRRDISYEDMVDYFARYNNASLGKIKNLYLKWVAYSPLGAQSRECLELNKLFSECVDGVKVEVPENLDTVPPSPEGSPTKQFILEKLRDSVKNFNFEAGVYDSTMSIDAIYEMLSGKSISTWSEFQLFLKLLEWCSYNDKEQNYMEDFLPYFDFPSFTNIQKKIVLQRLPPYLQRKYFGPIMNGLHYSQILSPNQLEMANLHPPNVQWKLFYSTFDDDGKRLLGRLQEAFENFRKKLLVYKVDEKLSVVMYIPEKLEVGGIIDVGGKEANETSSRHSRPLTFHKPKQGKINVPTVKLFAFDPLSGKVFKQTTTVGYKLSFDGQIVQLYQNRKADSFIWFSVNSLWKERNGIQQPQPQQRNTNEYRNRTKPNVDDNFGKQFKVSIALQKFSYDLRKDHPNRVQKQASSGLEIFVISNRNQLGRNILDITDAQVVTTEFRKISDSVSAIQSNIETIPLQLPELSPIQSEIIADKNLSSIDKVRNEAEVNDILQICISYRQLEILPKLLEKLLTDNQLQAFLSVGNIRRVLTIVPTSVLQLPVDLLKELSRKNLALRAGFVIAALESANEYKYIPKVLFFDILKASESLALPEAIDLVKRIVFTVQQPTLASEFIEVLIDVLHGLSPELAYAKKFITSLTLDYIERVEVSCIAKSKKFAADANANGTAVIPSSNIRKLSDFIDLAALGISAKNLESAPAIPEYAGLQIARAQSSGLYLTHIPLDIKSDIRNEDHVRFWIAKSKSHNIVVDAYIKRCKDGNLEFYIFQAEPSDFLTARWNLYKCESVTDLFSQFEAIKIMLTKGSDSTSAFPAICDLPIKSDVEVHVTPNLTSLGHLNESQALAIKTALNSPLTLIWGPPGTGKTSVIVEIILQFLELRPGLRYLITASTHNAVDNVMSKFLEARKKKYKGETSEDAIRLTSDFGRVASNLQRWTLDAFVGSNCQDDNAARGKAQKKFNQSQFVFSTCSGAGVGILREDSISTTPFSFNATDGADENDKTKKRRKKIQSFDVVIVDEASQLTEPNALVAIAKNSKFVILVGDHVQLCPTITTQIGKDCGLEKSLFEKLYTSSNLGSNSKVMLNIQYRMHPKLAQFPSTEFYEGNLKSGVTAVERSLKPSKFPWPMLTKDSLNPLVFIPCSSIEFGNGGISKSNSGQIQLTIQIVKLLQSECETKYKIVVITPYKNHREETERRLRGIEVCTIDGFQGREADIIIFPTVRANVRKAVGFCDDRQRINVALTRAKYGLILIGHPETLNGVDLPRKMVQCCSQIPENFLRLNST